MTSGYCSISMLAEENEAEIPQNTFAESTYFVSVLK